VDQASAIDLDRSNFLIDRPDPAHLKARGVERTLHAKIAFHDFGSDVLQQFRISLQGEHVFEFDANGTPCPLAAGLHAGAAVANDEDVAAEFPENRLVASLETFAKRGQDDNRNYSPHDAEHREEAPHLVVPQFVQHLRKNVHASILTQLTEG